MTNEERIERTFPDRFAAAEQSIREYLDIGREANARRRSRAEEYGAKTVQKVAEEYQVSPSIVIAAQTAARAYDDDTLSDLLLRCAEWRFLPNREILSLLGSIPADDRPEWEDRAISNHWSVRKLKLEKVAFYGRRPSGGRKHARPSTFNETFDKVRDLRTRWQSLRTVVLAATGQKDPDDPVKRPPFKLGKDVREMVNELTLSLDRLFDRFDLINEHGDLAS